MDTHDIVLQIRETEAYFDQKLITCLLAEDLSHKHADALNGLQHVFRFSEFSLHVDLALSHAAQILLQFVVLLFAQYVSIQG